MSNLPVLRWGFCLAVVAVLGTLALFITYSWQTPGSYLSGALLGVILGLTWSNFTTAVRERE